MTRFSRTPMERSERSYLMAEHRYRVARIEELQAEDAEIMRKLDALDEAVDVRSLAAPCVIENPQSQADGYFDGEGETLSERARRLVTR